MSFILKLYKEQAIVIIRIWYIIEHRANPSTIKKCCFFFKFWKQQFFLNFGRGAPQPLKIKFRPPFTKVLVAPLLTLHPDEDHELDVKFQNTQVGGIEVKIHVSWFCNIFRVEGVIYNNMKVLSNLAYFIPKVADRSTRSKHTYFLLDLVL